MNTTHSPVAVPEYDGDGTVMVPSQTLSLPATLSQEAAVWIGGLYRRLSEISQQPMDLSSVGSSESLEAARVTYTEAVKKQFEDCQQALLDSDCVSVHQDRVCEVEVDVVVPNDSSLAGNESRVILHFNDEQSLSGQRLLTSAICTAMRLGVRVVVPKCTVPPATARLAWLQNLLEIHEHFLATYPAGNIGWTGEARGAEKCTSLLVLAYQNGIAVPGAVSLIGIAGLEGEWCFHNKYLDASNLDLIINGIHDASDSGEDPFDPVLYPVNANMEIFPPCILFAGTRDTNFDSTVIYHREMKRAGCKPELRVVDGLPQSFHLQAALPEAIEVFDQIAEFFDSTLGGTSTVAPSTGDRTTLNDQSPLSDSVDEKVLLPTRGIRRSEHISREAQGYFHSMLIHYNSQFGSGTESKSVADIQSHFVSMWKDTSTVKNEFAANQVQLKVEECYAGNTRVDVIHPSSESARNSRRALIHFCGGVGFLGNEQLDVALQMARIMDVRVYLPRYRPFPIFQLSDQDEDVLRAYRFVQESNDASGIGVYGESSGASITARLIDHCKQNEWAMPGAIGLLGIGGLLGDSELLNQYMDPMAIQYNILHASIVRKNKGRSDGKPSAASELEIDAELCELPSYPPTTLVTGTLDQLMSSTVHFHRRLVECGVDTELNLYGGMPHSHHTISHLPEAEEALQELADFFDRKLQ